MRRARGRKPGGARARAAALLAPPSRRGAAAGSWTPGRFRRNSHARAGCRRCSSQPTPPQGGDPLPLSRVGALWRRRQGHSPGAGLTRGCEMPRGCSHGLGPRTRRFCTLAAPLPSPGHGGIAGLTDHRNHAEPGCVGSHRQTRAEHQGKRSGKEEGRKKSRRATRRARADS